MTNLSQRHVLVPTLAALLGLALTCSGASADAQQTSTAESRDTDDGPADSAFKANNASAISEVVVTGSRIRSASETSDSPLVSVGAAQIAAVGQTSLDTVLAQMPQFTGSRIWQLRMYAARACFSDSAM